MFQLKDILVLLFAVTLSLFFKWYLNDYYMNTLFNILGIMFSIAMGLLITFNLQGIKNKRIIDLLRSNIKEVRHSYIKYFAFSTLFYLLEKYLRDKGSNLYAFSIREISITINFSLITVVILVYSIIYFIINFIAMQKLNDNLYDEVNSKNS
nr:MAG TPA: hypothetical protein [Caudoviricetes sp.]